MYHKFLPLLLLITVNISLLAQKDFRPAFYINQDNDTISGLISYKGDSRNTKICVYKKNNSAPSEVFSPEEIIGFRFENGKFYVSKKVKIGDNHEIIFLEYLVNGITNLYYYRDGTGTNHYLIESADGNLLELTNEQKTKYIEGEGRVVVHSNKHIGLLKATFHDSPESQKLAETTSLNHKSLIKITTSYHNSVCTSEDECIVYEKKIPAAIFRFGLTAGFNSSSINFERHPYLNQYHFNPSYSPSIGIVLNFSLQAINEGLYLEYAGNISERYYCSDTYIAMVRYNQIYSNMELRIMQTEQLLTLRYVFPKWKIKPTIAVSGVFLLNQTKNFTTYTDNVNNIDRTITSNTISNEAYMPSFHYGGALEIGYLININEKLTFYNHLVFVKTIGITQFYDIITRNIRLEFGVLFKI